MGVAPVVRLSTLLGTILCFFDFTAEDAIYARADGAMIVLPRVVRVLRPLSEGPSLHLPFTTIFLRPSQLCSILPRALRR